MVIGQMTHLDPFRLNCEVFPGDELSDAATILAKDEECRIDTMLFVAFRNGRRRWLPDTSIIFAMSC